MTMLMMKMGRDRLNSLFYESAMDFPPQVKKQRRAKANDRERTRMQTLNQALGDNDDNNDGGWNENFTTNDVIGDDHHNSH